MRTHECDRHQGRTAQSGRIEDPRDGQIEARVRAVPAAGRGAGSRWRVGLRRFEHGVGLTGGGRQRHAGRACDVGGRPGVPRHAPVCLHELAGQGAPLRKHEDGRGCRADAPRRLDVPAGQLRPAPGRHGRSRHQLRSAAERHERDHVGHEPAAQRRWDLGEAVDGRHRRRRRRRITSTAPSRGPAATLDSSLTGAPGLRSPARASPPTSRSSKRHGSRRRTAARCRPLPDRGRRRRTGRRSSGSPP